MASPLGVPILQTHPLPPAPPAARQRDPMGPMAQTQRQGPLNTGPRPGTTLGALSKHDHDNHIQERDGRKELFRTGNLGVTKRKVEHLACIQLPCSHRSGGRSGGSLSPTGTSWSLRQSVSELRSTGGDLAQGWWCWGRTPGL